MNRTPRHIILITLLLLLGGTAMAQNDPQFVIKKNNHYLAHVNNALTNVNDFDPATCLWFSGPNVKNNYYFMDGSNRRYLKAPLEQGGTLSLSSSNPGTVVLNTTSDDYYFYAWDHGVARGVQRPMDQCTGENPALPNGLNPNGNQCWEVVWVSYEGDTWKMSTAESYSIVLNVAALQHRVTVTPHEETLTPVSGGINSVTGDFSMAYISNPHTSQTLNYEISPYSYSTTPAYTCYGFEAVSVHETNNNNHINPTISIDIPAENHYFDANGDALNAAPTATPYNDKNETGREWTISGDGSAYLSFSDTQSQLTSNLAAPTVYYLVQNNTNSHKQATITLTVTYEGGATQTRTITVTAKTSCKNPVQASAPVVTFEGVTVSWLPTADSYTVSWKKTSVSSWTSTTVGDVTSYIIRDLEGDTEYEYKVKADCSSEEPSSLATFTTKPQNAVILGSIFGGGRMADVTGTTEVVIVNCDSIGAVYGGNDIAGTVYGTVNNVSGAGGSTIVLGVNSGDTYATYGTTNAGIGVRIGDVYGGGNGYYAYNGTSIEQASYNTTYDVANGASIVAFTPSHPEGVAVWTNNTGSSQNWVCPTIPMADITVTNDYVKIDSLFGGAKNAILNKTTNDVNITINGGTIFTVFGGNNFGGSLGYQSHENITVSSTTVKTTVSEYQAKRLGRDFGIGYLFGGGNKVQGQNVAITINGGQTDTIFGGGNSADVRSTQVTVNCALNETYFQGLTGYSGNTITSIDAAYKWEGKGYYNIRTLFGGNNRANMAGVPTLNLTSGGIGTVYGGGNAGDMTADATDNGNGGTLTINDNNVKYGTHVKTDSPNILIDYLYGGCQMSNVYYSTWVEIKNGHVGTVYGGCNISGDVGSTRVHLDAQPFSGGVANENYQLVYGAPYVVASGGTVYNNIFAGSNGLYHCTDAEGVHYIAGLSFDPFEHSYVGMTVPTHNETYVIIKDNILVKGNVYAGGNMACVGFQHAYEAFPELVGLASVRMSGGTVDGNVFGGGNMASIYGSNEIQVSGGSIGVRLGGALYGGNDRLGKAGITSNRIMPQRYDVASDGYTSLNPGGDNNKVKTYLGITGSPTIHTVYGGGNGKYDDYDSGNYCDASNLPIQTNIFVDIAIDGGNNGGHIQNVFGGGNGVYADGFIKVFLNVQNCTGDTRDHVDTIYGGNNMGDMSVVPDIIMLHGNVHTVYGGCNSGAMAATGDKTKTFTVGGTTYDNVGSYVRLLSTYPGLPVTNNQPTYFTPTAKVTGAVYGGCRMNGVTNNSLVLVEGGNHSGANFFGGSDISGDVSGISYVVVNGSYANNVYNGVIGDAYGGGNGNYQYGAGQAYEGHTPPYCKDARVIMLNGQAANLYAGGYAGDCGITSLQLNDGLVSNKIFGGGNMAGTTTSHSLTTTTVSNGVSTVSTNNINTAGISTVTMNGGTVNTGVYGGSNAQGTIASNVVVNITGGTIGASTSARADVYGGGYGAATHTSGNVTVNIGATTGGENPTYSGAATINGDIYGGSALGQVSATGLLTQVNFYGGTVNGDVYGGGLGRQADPGNSITAVAAEVSGNVEVNIHGGTFNDAAGNANANDGDPSDGNTGGGCIYGCNNANGSPKGNVTVNIYATDHGNTEATNHYPTTTIGTVNALNTNAGTQTYAIKAVFGGGNLAAYVPDEVTSGDPHSATVHVYNCDNTIEDIFGGGNAADVGSGDVSTDEVTLRTDTYVIIEGGRIHRVIGGGNGEDLLKPAANIFGTANTTVYAGLINEVYGGANRQGSVDAINLTISNPNDPTFSPLSSCNDQVYGKVFGCANAADYNRSVTTNILCGVGTIGELYGGSNLADIGRLGSINANVTLNLYGGVHTQVFAGSKGDLPSVGGTDKASNIYGNVTLNLFGGKVTDAAYGGSNYNGNIAGKITVNVLDIEDANCTAEALDLNNVYGASNMADYEPTYTPVSPETERISPVVNVIHIAQTPGIRGNVYGGGNQAEVTASPQVNIGYHSSMSSQIPTDYPIAEANRRGYVSGNVFGGGNQAGVEGNPVVNMRDKGTVVTGIYGGCNDDGEIDGNINVNIYGGTMGTSTTARMTDGIFGGGKGNSTETSGNITVTINKETNEATAPIIYADIYGGSAFGEVGATGKTAKVNLKDGTVYGTIFGGGKGQLEDNNTNPVTPAYSATVSGATEVAIEGGLVRGTVISGSGSNAVTGAAFGGCNVNGIVLGNATVSYTGGAIGTTDDNANTYGGGLGPDTKVKGDVAVTVDGSGVNVYGDVYGGSAKGKVNTENGTSQSGTSKTDVTLTAGTIHGDLYGGGHGPDGNEAADVYGPITVTVEGGTATTAFGCNNNSGTPKSTVTVNIEGGTVTNVCGGGNVADYIPTTNNINSPAVNVKGGEVTNKVVGGGNAANIGSSTISCNPVVTISGGQVCTATTDAGVYGGCNTSGTVNGNITVNVTNADGNTTISSLAALQAIAAANGNPISIHGGGYGHLTSTTGNITVNFGAADASSEHSEYPMLYGDMYGGSALGTVNDDENDVTTVTVLNGEVKFAFQGNNQYGGNIYGGGLGDASHAAIVNGVVHVNIGNLDASNNPIGKASLKNCNVFGCNNKNGSPQRDVHVDVYQTNHTSSDEANNLNGDFAINSVYGGGNRANYSPTTNPTQSTPYSLKAYTTIHGCENTIGTVYGGGRAAASDGVVTNVDGGRFQYIFGGGNGQIDPADIGWGGIELTVCSGHVGYKYVGCDMGGTVLGTMHDNECSVNPCGTPLTVDYFFFGANKSTIIGGLSSTIPCADPPMTYQNVYAGSRLAVIYGDIHLVVEGGEITNLFGGSQGSVDRPGHVRRYPHLDNSDEMATVPQDAYNDMVTYLSMNPDLQGEGGNIYLTLKGGTLRNVYGGNQLYGTVDGDIIILVDDDPTSTCPLVIDTLYGGNEKAVYSPYPKEGNPRVSPQIYLKNGTVNYDVYGGSLGDRQSIIANAGKVNSHPYVLVGSDSNTHHATVGRNLYGGGSMAEVNGDTKVVLRGNATIGSDVYGGSRQGDVTGNTYVQIEPASVEPISIPAVQPPTPHTLNYGLNIPGSGTLSITNNHGDPIANGAQVAQGSVIHIHVIPNQGYEFYGWGVVGGGSVVQPYQTTSSLIIGSSDVTLTANFTDSNTTYHTLTLAPNTPGAGTFKVNGNVCNGSIQIPQGFPVTVQAIHEEGYVFGTWTVPSGLNITSGTTSTASITFNMGTGNVSLTANFTPTHTLTLTADPDGACTFTVKDDPYTGPVTMAEGTTVTLVATPAAGHEGDSILWSTNSGTLTGDTTSNTVTFTMGNANANVTVTFTTNP